jgi:hypothetical protein
MQYKLCSWYGNPNELQSLYKTNNIIRLVIPSPVIMSKLCIKVQDYWNVESRLFFKYSKLVIVWKLITESQQVLAMWRETPYKLTLQMAADMSISVLIYMVCSISIRIGIVVVHWVGCVCNQSWHVCTCLIISWHMLQVAAFVQLAVVGRGVTCAFMS